MLCIRVRENIYLHENIGLTNIYDTEIYIIIKNNNRKF